MNPRLSASAPAPVLPGRPARVPLAARAVLRLLQGLQHGRLELQLPDGRRLVCGGGGVDGDGDGDGPQAALRLLDWRACSATLARGDIGFAESYLEGHWTSPDPVALIALFLANREAIGRAVHGSWWGALGGRLRHAFNRNTRRGSRRNIHAHYDLGNRFYRLWLDETLNYSSALFEGDFTRSSAQAQQAKLQRALAEVGLQPGQRLLEIGCGWGALAEAAARAGAHVTGLTLSTEQLAWAQRRLQGERLAARAQLRLQDWRDLDDEPFDAIVSIEMFEAVGEAYWPAFFRTLHERLRPGGRACIQSITIRDELFPRYRRSTDFIQQYIFPGGLLPSPAVFREQARRAGFTVERELAFGADYAETLRRWREQFLAREAEVRGLGFDTRFVRLWEFYLAYCQAAFAAGDTDVVQFTLRRPT